MKKVIVLFMSGFSLVFLSACTTSATQKDRADLAERHMFHHMGRSEL